MSFYKPYYAVYIASVIEDKKENKFLLQKVDLHGCFAYQKGHIWFSIFRASGNLYLRCHIENFLSVMYQGTKIQKL